MAGGNFNQVKRLLTTPKFRNEGVPKTSSADQSIEMAF
jgi:hypothetical protein